MVYHNPTVLAEAAFSQDMAETLFQYFGDYERGGVVRVEVTTHGLWIRHPSFPARKFLGLAERPGARPIHVSKGSH